MAAGDVVISADVVLDRQLRFLAGTVTLDGSNPTPVALANYVGTLLFGQVNMDGSVATGDDPNYVTSTISGTSLNVYVWKNTTGTDPTMIASTDNARLVDWFAIGTLKPAQTS